MIQLYPQNHKSRKTPITTQRHMYNYSNTGTILNRVHVNKTRIRSRKKIKG